MHIVSFVIGGFLAYLLGAIPCGYLLARWRGVDIRTVGSGNIGATNVFRSVGKGWGVLTFICDALKGYIAAGLLPYGAGYIGAPGSLPLAVACAGLAIIGHNWPIYLRFRGGKGIATSLGALTGLAPAAAGLGLLCWVLVFGMTRYVSVASMAAAAAVGIAGWFLYPADRLLSLMLALLAVVAIWRHQANIRRLLKGTEHRFQRSHN